MVFQLCAIACGFHAFRLLCTQRRNLRHINARLARQHQSAGLALFRLRPAGKGRAVWVEHRVPDSSHAVQRLFCGLPRRLRAVGLLLPGGFHTAVFFRLSGRMECGFFIDPLRLHPTFDIQPPGVFIKQRQCIFRVFACTGKRRPVAAARKEGRARSL